MNLGEIVFLKVIRDQNMKKNILKGNFQFDIDPKVTQNDNFNHLSFLVKT